MAIVRHNRESNPRPFSLKRSAQNIEQIYLMWIFVNRNVTSNLKRYSAWIGSLQQHRSTGGFLDRL